MRRLSEKPRSSRTCQGVALVIALALLLIVTLLAVSAMVMSTAELAMAGNEQFHRSAADAASAGVEGAIARLARRAVSRDAAMTTAGTTAAGRYVATMRYAGEESSLPAFSAEKFAALHFEIDSTAQSARKAVDEQFQGVMLIVPRSAADAFTRIGDGLAGGGVEP